MNVISIPKLSFSRFSSKDRPQTLAGSYAMARFLGGLNQEIQDILAYKEYNNITKLFHLACKAEQEVQG
jgi:hypothetical protein